MNTAELAQKMLEWRKKRIELDELESEITAAVLEAKETVVVGDVRARYSRGRKSYDYETPGKAAGMDVVAKYTTTITTNQTDWRKVCKEIGVSGIVKSVGEPSVKLIIEV